MHQPARETAYQSSALPVQRTLLGSPHLPRSGQEANHPPLKIPEHKEQFRAETRAPTRPVTQTGPVGKDSNRAG